MTQRKLLFGALGILVVCLIFGSVYTTGARWVDDEPGPGAPLTTGSIGLDARDGSATGTFPNLAGTGITTGNVTQATLRLVNTGSTRIKFQLSQAGPAVSTLGSATVKLSGIVASSCPSPAATDLMGTPAFTATSTSAPTSATTGIWRVLEKGGSEAWCIRAVLTALTGTPQYRIKFLFDVGQLRPGQNP